MTTKLGITGGTGVYSLEGLNDVKEIEVDTPYGSPSSPITHGRFGEVEVFFIARHGRKHTIPPSAVPFRANVFALKQLGVQWMINVSAMGSLREEMRPGDFVIPDQIMDDTRHRIDTFFDKPGVVAHIAFADPYCKVLSAALYQACEEALKGTEHKAHMGGTCVVFDGPAFNARARSHTYRAWGCDTLSMTTLPEAKLAREAEIAYASIGMMTDYDCWREETETVDAGMVARVMKENAMHAKRALEILIPKLPSLAPSPYASRALDAALLTDLANVSKQTLLEKWSLVARLCDERGVKRP